jgi:hypothetical protein
MKEGKIGGLEVALELSGIAIRRLKENDGGSVKGDLLATFRDELDCIQRDEARFATRANREKPHKLDRRSLEKRQRKGQSAYRR